jgi:enamine deaminase RidA (YjgF/YER057c/UK114 family)
MTSQTRAFYPGSAASVAGGLPASHATSVGDLLFISGTVAIDDNGAVTSPGDVAGQTCDVLNSLAATLAAAGGSLADLTEVASFHSDPRDIDTVLSVAADFFDPADGYPAWTPVGFLGTTVPGVLVMIRAVARIGAPKTAFAATDAALPAPAGASVRSGDLVFIAGQSAAAGGPKGSAQPMDHRAQATAAYDQILRLVHDAGGGVDDILDFTSYHQDIRGAAPTLDEIYMPKIMGPIETDEAATTSHLGATGLYGGVVGTYTALADLGGGARVGSTPDVIWWKGVYPIAGAAKKEHGQLVTIAGQVASAPDGSILHEGDVEAQARFIFQSMADTLAGFGLTMAAVVDVRSFHKDARWAPAIAQVAAEFFDPASPPAWTYTAIPGLWFEGYLHEIAAIAVVP